MKGAFQLASSIIFFIYLGLCITELNWNYHHGILGPKIRSDNYRISGKFRNPDGGRRQRHQFFRIFNHGQQSSDSSESPQAKRAAINCAAEKNNNQATTQNGLPHGLVLEPAKEDLGAFVIQMDATHWQHELQILSAMSTNTLLKVTANGTLNGKRIIRPRDSATQLWLQSCSSISGKPVKFTQLIRKTTVTAVLLNVHPFISMEALLMDDRISSAERISTYNPSTKCMEPSRSVKVTLNMKNVPSELHINFIGRFFVRSYVTKPVRCYRCQRFGHLAAACLAKLERCSMCSGHHRTQQCIVKIQNSELVKLKCANCGEKHSANSNRCSVLREKMQQKMNNVSAKSRTTTMKQQPPFVTSAEYPHVSTSNTRNTSDTRKRSLTGTATGATTSYSEAAKHHVPRSVVLAARLTSKTGALSHGSKDNSAEHPSPKQGSEQKSAEHQPITIDHRRKRGAAHALEPNTASKKSTVSETTASRTTTSENTTNQLPSPAETYDKIFAILMSQMEQLRPLFMIQDLGTKNIVRKMVKSIRELLDDLVELQSN